MASTLRYLFLCTLLLLVAQLATAKVYQFQPEQVHLSFGEETSNIVVTWSTRDNALESIVEYGIGTTNFTAKGSAKKFVDGGAAKASQYIHRVTLKNLKPKTKYVYHCGGKMGWSPEFWFVTPPSGSDWSPHVALFGDMGNENAQSLPRLQEDTQREMYDAIVHIGDFAYDMHVDNARVGDEFMRQIESIAAYVPYMVVPGNHEERYNFSNYRARFSMPGSTDNYMYSFNLGPIHFIGFSTEVYYFMNYGLKSAAIQYDWLEKDLKEATKPENRKLRPWIIIYGHRPMYSSKKYKQTLVRLGLPLSHLYGVEKLFYKYGVDVEIWAHEHSYWRYWPIYDYKVYNGSYDKPYTNPGAPVHLITGSAGCKEGRQHFTSHIPYYSAFHSRDYGYTRLKAHNGTHLYFEQISDDKNGAVIDSFWVIKHSHEPYQKTSDIVVTWSTKNNALESIVEYGIDGMTHTAKGSATKFVDGGALKASQYIHRVTLKNLKPKTKYVYHCGGKMGWSPEFWFVTPPSGSDWSPHVALFGDMGNENAQSLPRLQEDTQREMYDAIIHVGDFAYDMHVDNARVGDEFMRQIESIAAYAPYMVVPGNHEERYNFSNYRARFSMPGSSDNYMYSFNLGPVHFIGFSTEVYYFMNYGLKSVSFQYDWLERDLKEATKPENRKLRPWIITYGHRPMYCSNKNDDDCTHNQTLVRVGLPFLHLYGLEKMFYKYGVDVEIWAHEHSYERYWPLYDYKVYNGSYQAPYTNPGAPIHLVTGSAGCKEGRENFIPHIPDYSAFHSRDYGYTRLKAHNGTHLYFEQISDDKNGAVIDSFWVIKHSHEAYPPRH